jgi:hypothetical protein
MLDGDEYVRGTLLRAKANQNLLNLILGRILSRSYAVGGRNTTVRECVLFSYKKDKKRAARFRRLFFGD